MTFRLQGVAVYTSGVTEFKKGPCTDLNNGDHVKVDGQKMSDGRVRADKIEFLSAIGDRVELKGEVEALTGTCPAITFRLTGFTVYTSTTTEFDDGACGDVKNGRRIDVKGRRMPDGRVHADEVEVD